MASFSPAARVLDDMHIPHRLFIHASLPLSLEQAALERGQEPGQVIRSILFRHGQDQYVMVLMSGAAQVSWKAIRRHLGVSRISLARAEEVRRVTGYEVGTVNPLGLPRPVRLLADQGVFTSGELSIGSGVRGTAIILATSDFKQALGAIEVGAFSAA